MVSISDLHIRSLAPGSAPRSACSPSGGAGDRYLRALAQAKSRLRTDRQFAMQVLQKYTAVDDPECSAPPWTTTGRYTWWILIPLAKPSRRSSTPRRIQRRARPAEDLLDLRYAERLRSSGFLDRLPR